MKKRLIGRLDIKGPNLVKGINLEGLRVLGDPAEFARHYYSQGIDELLYMDVVASLYSRNSLSDFVSKTAKNIFVPIAVGGGLRSIDDIKSVLRSGADKVVLNTAAVVDPDLIRKASKLFGASTIVVAIEAIKGSNGQYFAHTDNGRESSGREVIAWAQEVAELGAGEIIITSVDREGTGTGFDLSLIKSISECVGVPVIAHGGCGHLDHAISAFEQGHADAIAVASVLHYEAVKELNSKVNLEEGNTEFLKNFKVPSYIQPNSVQSIKSALHKASIPIRLSQKKPVEI